MTLTIAITETTFGARLRRLRREEGLSQADLARAVGVHESAISLLESAGRNPSARLLEKLADRLGMTMDDLWRTPP